MRLDERGSAEIPMVGVDVSSLSPRDDPGTQLSRNLPYMLKVGVVMQDHRAVMLGHGSTGGLRPAGCPIRRLESAHSRSGGRERLAGIGLRDTATFARLGRGRTWTKAPATRC
jgi:hypothetical protein